jgi:hypothetical protein
MDAYQLTDTLKHLHSEKNTTLKVCFTFCRHVVLCLVEQEEARARAEAQAKAQAEARRKQEEARAAAAEAARKKQEAARGGSTKIGRGTSTVVARGGSTASDAAKRKQVRLISCMLLFWRCMAPGMRDMLDRRAVLCYAVLTCAADFQRASWLPMQAKNTHASHTQPVGGVSEHVGWRPLDLLHSCHAIISAPEGRPLVLVACAYALLSHASLHSHYCDSAHVVTVHAESKLGIALRCAVLCQHTADHHATLSKCMLQVSDVSWLYAVLCRAVPCHAVLCNRRRPRHVRRQPPRPRRNSAKRQRRRAQQLLLRHRRSRCVVAGGGTVHILASSRHASSVARLQVISFGSCYA